ncbi:hypothetical protein [Paenibacillus ihumii]|uniref:hypothetical protein n=1 Tax=Paenibacillus ihumii TaxID=687436 RepID=UPI0006D7C84B|nr:hypothetical protein [Paenibacillus ihumii]
MKWRRVMVLVLAFSLTGGSMLFADSATQKVKLSIDGREVEEGAYVIDGKTYVPVRELEGLAEYDEATKKVTYYKPNVHIFLFKGKDIFSDIEKAGKLKFSVFSQIDNLKTEISAIKVAITAPDGTSKTIQTKDVKDTGSNFYFVTDDYTYDFKTAGKYTLGFYMKPASGSSDFVLVSEKSINVLK